jgi:hypothetical protein
MEDAAVAAAGLLSFVLALFDHNDARRLSREPLP